MIIATTEANQDISYNDMVGGRRLNDIVRNDPDVDAFASIVGGGGPGGQR